MASKTANPSTVPFADAPINASLTGEQKIDLLRTMVRIRRFEQTSLKYYHDGHIGGFLHLYIGQESVAVGSISLLGEHDHVITAYRDHGHALSVGMGMDECMAELFGKKTGCSKGKGGSMHYFAPDKNYWGGHGIVGGQTPLGAGLAFALKYKGLKGCCLCYLGDGAINQGAFHEAVTNLILSEMVEATKPRFMRLTARWYVRGGIFTTVIAEHRKRGWKPSPRVDLVDFPKESSVR